ncbi:ROK family protein [Roseivirga sp. BDSF3-8]|uniref:ROK family protein n=1 Tax=Roseivirga sp. BDSF3-8 TaxID=3241598 RepID=UPI0035328082
MSELALGIDIGGTYTKFGYVDKDGNILAEGKLQTFGHASLQAYLQELNQKLDVLEQSLSGYTLKGIGIGAPNANIYKGTIEHAPNLEWKGIVPFVEEFKKFRDYPVTITNDANAAAIGEMVFGAARGMKHFIVITLGTGLGSGIVVDGKLVYGADGFAGELGHVIAIEGGRMCSSGKRGCLEAYVSATGICRTVFELLSDAIVDSPLRDYSYRELTSKTIYEAAVRGDYIASQAFEYTGNILGRKLADFVAATSPEAIFIFGGLAGAGDLLLKPVRKSFEKYLFNVYNKDNIAIRLSGLGEKSAAILGASALVWEKEKTDQKSKRQGSATSPVRIDQP